MAEDHRRLDEELVQGVLLDLPPGLPQRPQTPDFEDYGGHALRLLMAHNLRRDLLLYPRYQRKEKALVRWRLWRCVRRGGLHQRKVKDITAEAFCNRHTGGGMKH